MNLEKPSSSDLAQVLYDNIRSNQIGGHTDGITPEVAKDLGFDLTLPEPTTPEPTEAKHGVLLKDSEDQAHFDAMLLDKRRSKVATDIGGKTIKAAQKPVIMNAIRHEKIRGAEKRAANLGLRA